MHNLTRKCDNCYKYYGRRLSKYITLRVLIGDTQTNILYFCKHIFTNFLEKYCRKSFERTMDCSGNFGDYVQNIGLL